MLGYFKTDGEKKDNRKNKIETLRIVKLLLFSDSNRKKVNNNKYKAKK